MYISLAVQVVLTASLYNGSGIVAVVLIFAVCLDSNSTIHENVKHMYKNVINQ